MQLAGLVNQVAVHRCGAGWALAFVAQQLCLALVVLFDIYGFLARNQIERLGTALLGLQRVTGTPQEYPGARCTDLHVSLTFGALNIGVGWFIRTHAIFRIRRVNQTLREAVIKGIEHLAPICVALSDGIKLLFHARRETVVEQIIEVLNQSFGNQLTHSLGVKPPILERHIAAILDRRDNRRVGRRPANTTLLQFFHQTGFAVTWRRLGKVLNPFQFFLSQHLSHLKIRQSTIFLTFGGWWLYPGIAIELQYSAANT